jgi:hypothetical protein
MKILGIDKTRSTSTKLILKTEPPIKAAVFEKFVEISKRDGFEHSVGSLVWTGPLPLPDDFASRTEMDLTAAEEALKTEDTRAKDEQKSFLQEISKQTGLPLI